VTIAMGIQRAAAQSCRSFVEPRCDANVLIDFRSAGQEAIAEFVLTTEAKKEEL